jgi:outer membrane protein TolC
VAGLLLALSGEIASAEAMLNVSLARPATDSLPELQSPALGDAPPPALTVAEQAVAQRPELRGGDAELRRALAEIQVMRSMYAPMATIRGGTARTMEAGPGWMLMVGISIPIWRSKLRAGVEEANAMAEMARDDLEAMRRMIEGEAVAARHELVAAIARMDALRLDVVPRTRQAVGPALAGYRSGQLPLASVIQASQGLWNAQAELVEAEVRAAQARARLHRATGTKGESR